MQRQFDEAAHRVEARLRDLRQLVAGLPILMDTHEEMLSMRLRMHPQSCATSCLPLVVSGNHPVCPQDG